VASDAEQARVDGAQLNVRLAAVHRTTHVGQHPCRARGQAAGHRAARSPGPATSPGSGPSSCPNVTTKALGRHLSR
jgi:hypothetical protein